MEYRDRKHENRLMKAVERNDVSSVEAILQSMQRKDIFLDINNVNEDNKTPLTVAITSKQTGE